jgi:hypothetical protein
MSEINGGDLRSMRSQSCGCQRGERLAKANYKDGLSKHPLRGMYAMMKDRCSNPRNHAYPRYGGRGIIVCERWRISFKSFLEDVGPRPSPKHSLHRIDGDGPYSPENCKWATPREHTETRHNFKAVDRKPRKHIERVTSSSQTQSLDSSDK